MSKSSRNPVLYAIEQMYELVNNHGDFTFSQVGLGSVALRFHLEGNREVSLLQRSVDLDNGVTSLFFHETSQTLILLRECESRSGSEQGCGELIIAATSQNDVNSAIIACTRDLSSIEWFLQDVHGDGE